MKILKFGIMFFLPGLLYIGCSQNPSAPGNQFVPHGSIIVVDDKNQVANYVSLSTGQKSGMIGSAMGPDSFALYNVLVEGNFAYFLIEDSPSYVKKYDLTSGQWTGAVTYSGEGYAQGITGDGNSFYISFENGFKTSANMELLSIQSFSKIQNVGFLQPAEGIFYTNGNVYLCLSDGYSSGSGSYGNSKVSVINSDNLQVTSSLSVLTNPYAIDSDGAGNIYAASLGTYSDDGGITKIIGTTASNIVIGKSLSMIICAAGNIYAVENNYIGNPTGIFIYNSSGVPQSGSPILPGLTVNSIIYYNGYIYAEANNSIYKIRTTDNAIVNTYNNVIDDDSYGCAMAVYE